MNVLLSSIGSRGDVQPILALALELRAQGHGARLCAAPNFSEWIESFGLSCVPIGPDLEKLTGRTATDSPRPSAEQLQRLATHTVREHFSVLASAARGCEAIVAAGALQVATRSVAEALNVPYFFATYCPAVLPSADHPPPKIAEHHPQSLPEETIRSLWSEEERIWNDLFRAALNEERSKVELAPIDNVQRYIFTDQPWLAADPVLAPAGASANLSIVQTGAWLLPQPHTLPEKVDAFLAAGEPPLYCGFGSMRASDESSAILIEAARTLGRRAIISKGWGNLTAFDAGADVLVIDDVAHDRLLPRVAAVVHHGGAGTITAAARAGRSQVVVPHLYDQFYWAHRVQQLGIGVSVPGRESLSVDELVLALRKALRTEVAARARALAPNIRRNGARHAARQLISALD